jgi:hypothetical protein
MTDNPQYDRVTCYFCLSEERQILEEHHIVPLRFDGSDDAENMVRLCPTCHKKLERLYDGRFYDELGVENPDSGESTDTGIHTSIKGEDGSEVLSLLDVIEDSVNSKSTGLAGAPLETVIDRATSEFDVGRDRIQFEIRKLKQKGEVYEPRSDILRTT